MRGVSADRRQARFHCLLLLRGPEGREEIFEGDCHGAIADAPSGRAGFGYDPIFVPEGRQVTYAELSEPEKNEISHRGRAWRALVKWLARSGN
jgi:XTP/dITP diphosphohydrolase